MGDGEVNSIKTFTENVQNLLRFFCLSILFAIKARPWIQITSLSVTKPDEINDASVSIFLCFSFVFIDFTRRGTRTGKSRGEICVLLQLEIA